MAQILVRESGSRSYRQNVCVAHRLGATWNSGIVGELSATLPLPGSCERNDHTARSRVASMSPVLALVESNSLNAAIGRAGST